MDKINEFFEKNWHVWGHQLVSIDGYTALTAACFSGNFKMLSRLIELGADVNYQKSAADYPPIFYVCRFCKDNVEIWNF